MARPTDRHTGKAPKGFQDLIEPTILDNKVSLPKTESEMTYKDNRKLELLLQFLGKRKFNYKVNVGNIHSVLEGQYRNFILENIRANATIEVAHNDKCPTKYLKVIQKLCCNKIRHKHYMKSLCQATKTFQNLTQNNNKSMVEYFKSFNNAQKALGSFEGILDW